MGTRERARWIAHDIPASLTKALNAIADGNLKYAVMIYEDLVYVLARHWKYGIHDPQFKQIQERRFWCYRKLRGEQG